MRGWEYNTNNNPSTIIFELIMKHFCKPINVSKKLSDGREVSIETGKLAKQADGSVVLTMGKTMILASVVSKKEAKENVDFLPLSVDNQE